LLQSLLSKVRLRIEGREMLEASFIEWLAVQAMYHKNTGTCVTLWQKHLTMTLGSYWQYIRAAEDLGLSA